jgi:hypothetical protein
MDGAQDRPRGVQETMVVALDIEHVGVTVTAQGEIAGP